MKWQDKGWLRKYLATRHHYVLHQEFERLRTLKSSAAASDQLLYELMQPTGLLYGYPTQMPYSYRALLKSLRVDQLSAQEKWKIILLESLLNSALTTDRYHHLEKEVDFADAISEVGYRIGEYYCAIYPAIQSQFRGGIFSRNRKAGIDLSEHAIESRTKFTVTGDEFWSSIVHSALSFIDVYCFHIWIQSYHDKEQRKLAVEGHIQLRLLMLHVLGTAAWSNDILEKEEQDFLRYYLLLAQLPEETEQAGKKIIEERISMADVQWEQANSPVLKRYLLELATMIILSDKVLSKTEQEFLNDLSARLNIEDVDAQHSIIAVESFVVEHWQSIPYLNQNKDVEAMMMYLLSKLKLYFDQQTPQLISYLQQHPDIGELLHRSKIETISTEERKKIREGMIDALQSTSAFQSSVVPRSLLTFPVLMNLIPEALYATHQSQEP